MTFDRTFRARHHGTRAKNAQGNDDERCELDNQQTSLFSLTWKLLGKRSKTTTLPRVMPRQRRPSRSTLQLLLLLACSTTTRLVHAQACGEPGRAYFYSELNPQPQGVYGELYSAVRCYYNQTSWCRSTNLADEARGSNASSVMQYYGADISRWCTGLVTNFDSTFANMPVSDVAYGTGSLALDLALSL